jgi:hypothetical protein
MPVNYVSGLCCINLCTPDTSTDIDYLLDNCGGIGSPSTSSEYFVVEFGTEKPDIRLKVGQHIKTDDIIGYMRGIPVRSQINGVITEITDRYFIGIYENNIENAMEDLGIGNDLSEDALQKIFYKDE